MTPRCDMVISGGTIFDECPGAPSVRRMSRSKATVSWPWETFARHLR